MCMHYMKYRPCSHSYARQYHVDTKPFRQGSAWYCPCTHSYSVSISYILPRLSTSELHHVRDCTLFFHVHVRAASQAVTCNKCVIDCGFGQDRTQYTRSQLRCSGVYRTVLPSPQSIIDSFPSKLSQTLTTN